MINQFFAQIFATNDPLTVIVHDDKWEAAGPETPRNYYLYTMLQGFGGINQSVPAGIYHFNARSNWFQVNLSLEPVEL